MRILLVLPILLPLLSAIVAMFAWRRPEVQRFVGIAGAAALTVAAAALLSAVMRDGMAAAFMGAWPAPFGIALVADHFSAVLILTCSFLSLIGAIYSAGSVDRRRQALGYYTLLHIMMTGVCGSLLTGDVFNLFVWFELMLVASFALLALGGERGQLEGALKYLMLNMLASALFLTGVGILYRLTGTINFADMAVRLGQLEDQGLATLAAILLMIAFGTKAGIFPLFFWLPASYHTPPVAITAIFSGLLTKVGVYALVRTFTLLFDHDPGFTHNLILIIGGLTMVTGVLGAMAQQEVRRLLSFHIISQIGYMLMGLGLATALSLAATLYFMVHIMITKMALFLVCGMFDRLRGTYDLRHLGGLYAQRPLVTFLFIVPALSLGGMPPLSGFIGKLSLVKAGLEVEQYAIVATALAVSVLTLYSMAKIWNGAFWGKKPASGAGSERAGPSPAPAHDVSLPHSILWPAGILAALSALLGLGAGSFFDIALIAGEELMNTQHYIETVLGALKEATP